MKISTYQKKYYSIEQIIQSISFWTCRSSTAVTVVTFKKSTKGIRHLETTRYSKSFYNEQGQDGIVKKYFAD